MDKLPFDAARAPAAGARGAERAAGRANGPLPQPCPAHACPGALIKEIIPHLRRKISRPPVLLFPRGARRPRPGPSRRPCPAIKVGPAPRPAGPVRHFFRRPAAAACPVEPRFTPAWFAHPAAVCPPRRGSPHPGPSRRRLPTHGLPCCNPRRHGLPPFARPATRHRSPLVTLKTVTFKTVTTCTADQAGTSPPFGG